MFVKPRRLPNHPRKNLVFAAVVACLSMGVTADSARDHARMNSDPLQAIRAAADLRTVSARLLVSVDGRPVDGDGLGVEVANTLTGQAAQGARLGRGAYEIVLNDVPRTARKIEITARVPNPSAQGEPLEQTLIVDVSEDHEIEIPINLSTH